MGTLFDYRFVCVLAWAGLSGLTTVACAQSQETALLYHRSLAATCATCHGTDAKGVENAGMPLINQLSPQELLAQLMAYKSGSRPGTIMPQLAKGYTDEQLQIIANVLGKK